MAYKEWFRRLQPIQIYLVLFLTIAFFIVELIYSYFTHALTLLVNAYYMLCNIVALIGCIASIKYSNLENSNYSSSRRSQNNSVICVNSNSSIETKEQLRSDNRMKNSFGWARINILTMLVCCVLLGSFCFSLQVESLQTLVHISHHDAMHHAMHHPLAVLRIGVAGIFLNIFCYILIGGYTFHHGSSIYVNKNGRVILKRNATTVAKDDKQQQQQPQQQQEKESSKELQNGSHNSELKFPGRPGIRGIFRDILGCAFVVLVSVLVHYTNSDSSEDFVQSNDSDHSNYSVNLNRTDHSDQSTDSFHFAKFIDPVIAIVSSTTLLILSYPYMKESGLILLQTIPNHININSLKKELLAAFPGIVNVHDLHVWQLTGEKFISTAHIIFLNPTVYTAIRHQVNDFFVELGITKVTIQPEFQTISESTERIDCLIKCRGEKCSQSVCCLKETSSDNLSATTADADEIKSCNININKKFDKKEIIPAIDSPQIDLKRFTLNTNDDNLSNTAAVNVSSSKIDENQISEPIDDRINSIGGTVRTSVIELDDNSTSTLTTVAEVNATILNNKDLNIVIPAGENISERNFNKETV